MPKSNTQADHNTALPLVKPYVGFYDPDPKLPWYLPIIDSEVIKEVSTTKQAQLTLLGNF